MRTRPFARSLPLLPLLTFALPLAGPVAVARSEEAKKHGGAVEIWVRKAGGERQGLKKLELDGLPSTEIKRQDVQYEGGTFAYKGVALKALLAKYAPPASVDLALLRFANGMLVPLPFRDDAVMARLDPFVARARVGDGALRVGEFPSLSRTNENYVDVKPIAFSGNKLVVADRFHPDVPAAHAAAFSPWLFADTLVAIELVKGSAWYAQFDLEAAGDAHAGALLVRQSCQYCHGARKVGASFGWDFVEPIPAFAVRRTERALFFHIRYRAASEQMRGAQMPALKHMTEDDARKLMAGLRVIGTRELGPYKP